MPDLPQILKSCQPLILLAFLMALMQLLGPETLRYDPRAIAGGEFWRLLTGHLVHANARHLLLNLTGLILCQALTGVRWRLWQWGWRILWLASAISLGFWLLQPQIHWYVGFSGVLFGLYLLAAVEVIRQQPLVSSLLILLLLAKILIEQFSSVKIGSSEWIGVPVLVDAHLYGFLAALLLLMLQWIGRRTRIQIAHE